MEVVIKNLKYFPGADKIFFIEHIHKQNNMPYRFQSDDGKLQRGQSAYGTTEQIVEKTNDSYNPKRAW